MAGTKENNQKYRKQLGEGIKCTDHLGQEFPSLAAMLRHWDVPDISYRYRRNKLGWDLEKTLTTKTMNSDDAGCHECTDHLGQTFKSKRAMCDHWRIPRHIYFRRISEGWSVEDALTKPLKYNGKRKMIKDHLGNEFINVDEMCEFWKTTKQQYIINIRNNLTVEQSLTQITEKPKHPKDHKGIEYKSINEMCRTYNITKTTLRSRLELGWTLEQILENPGNHSFSIKVKDHLGNEFKTQDEMLKYHNVHYTTYTHRKKAGLSMAECLSPDELHSIKCEDHLGNKYECLQDMLIFWFDTPGMYHTRSAKNMPMKNRLTDIRVHKKMNEHLYVKGMTGEFFNVVYKKHEYIMSDVTLYRLLRHEKIIESLVNMRYKDIEVLNIYSLTDKNIPMNMLFRIMYNEKEYIIDTDVLYRLMFFIKTPVVL